ncbi:MAG: lipoyl(octanoyl) transferase LipB [Chloroflexi bacterium]|jgi:lipoate-protein ligase B|nr:lipoyl(octanoyl) transferase LipB [Chloroflexota bacterium]MBT4515560.1 lipoyl(octanoyl) transferase LipB [Chloroflexota bacterium]MBT6681191.1 lipoyl(octanoyl) transferase LipB [Chloroflexota bacterium]
MTAPLQVSWLGMQTYDAALATQRQLHERRVSGETQDTLLLLEHSHVITMGRRALESHVVSDADTLAKAGVEVVETDRGGEATYHGPGQLIAYPIIDLRALGLGPVSYVAALEEAIIDTLAVYLVDAHRVAGRTGIWVGGDGEDPGEGNSPAGRKIAAIGVRISRGVAMHGLALNVSTDLLMFNHIVPCGMPGLKVTSIDEEQGAAPPVKIVGEQMASELAKALGLDSSDEIVASEATQPWRASRL